MRAHAFNHLCVKIGQSNVMYSLDMLLEWKSQLSYPSEESLVFLLGKVLKHYGYGHEVCSLLNSQWGKSPQSSLWPAGFWAMMVLNTQSFDSQHLWVPKYTEIGRKSHSALFSQSNSQAWCTQASAPPFLLNRLCSRHRRWAQAVGCWAGPQEGHLLFSQGLCSISSTNSSAHNHLQPREVSALFWIPWALHSCDTGTKADRNTHKNKFTGKKLKSTVL